MFRHLLLRLPGLAALAVAAAAQTITFAEGTATSLQIVAVAEQNPNGPAVVVLANVELMPLEVTGRTLADEADAARSRRLVRHGIARVELPGGGRLFHYRRAGGQYWGFLRIAADGAPAVVLELPGAGGALASPFADRIAVAADGVHAAVPLAAGGLHVVRLDGSLYASTGRPDRLAAGATIVVVPTSVMAGAAHVFFVTAADQVMRCGFADGAGPVDVSPPPVANAVLKDEMALSRDGQHAVFLHGPVLQQRLWQVGTAGPATVLPPPPSKYEEPGYLPEGPGEPAMLLNDDGTRLFFIDANVRDELHLLDLGGALPALQITENGIFQPYIGAHILPKFHGPALTVAIGDPGQMDWFRVALDAQGGTVANLTGTGSLQQPFPSGQLDPVQATDTGSALLIAEQQAAALALRRLDPQTGANTIVQQDLLAPPQPGSATTGVADVRTAGIGGDRLYRGTTGNPFAQSPAGVLLTAPVHGPVFAATWVHLPIDWGMVAIYLADGTVLAGPLEYGLQQLVATASGGLVLVGHPLRYLAPGVFTVINRPAASVRLCLSGAGA